MALAAFFLGATPLIVFAILLGVYIKEKIDNLIEWLMVRHDKKLVKQGLPPRFGRVDTYWPHWP